MSISLLQNATAVAYGGTNLPFQAVSGVAPYTYSVQAGGAGGSINPSTGLYVSPSNTGVDTIIAIDSTTPSPQMVTATVIVATPIELVCDIIRKQMGFSTDQVWLYNQKVNIPNDSRPYVTVGVLTCKPFGNSTSWDSSGSGLGAVQSTNFLATLSIDILSRGIQALELKERVLLTLSSIYAEQQMELNSFRIFQISTNFVNLSEVDGAAIPYHFNISVGLQYFVKTTQSVGYFDTFGADSVLTNS
jgi:hypothetical protein